jgi:hypothetical protein
MGGDNIHGRDYTQHALCVKQTPAFPESEVWENGKIAGDRCGSRRPGAANNRIKQGQLSGIPAFFVGGRTAGLAGRKINMFGIILLLLDNWPLMLYFN